MLKETKLEFQFSRIPKIIFGKGSFTYLNKYIENYEKNVLIITGAFSFRRSKNWTWLVDTLTNSGFKIYEATISKEPSPYLVDEVVTSLKTKNISLVVAIGGGSTLDAGKAISAMLPQESSVLDYLEGVGKGKIHDGRKIPVIAVPTTSGTGSEATKNAVLSHIGENGFKRSLRHENFVPELAIVDPELMLSCPPDITAAAGMDAFTQLLESYVSPNASPMTDALAYSGMNYIKDNLIIVNTCGTNSIEARSAMAYGSLLSGITLANAGLGIVHGLASPIGSFFEIPHGVVCGSLVAAATEINIKNLIKFNHIESDATLHKYAKVGRLINHFKFKTKESALNGLITKLKEWTETLKIPLLSDFGMKQKHLDKIIKSTENKNNPIKLPEREIQKILLERMVV